jgi:hypothetical protein
MDYKQKPFGFDRTQMFKEFETPMIHRMSALQSALKYFESNGIYVTPLELKAATKGILSFIEENDWSVFERLNNYLEKKEQEAKQELQPHEAE